MGYIQRIKDLRNSQKLSQLDICHVLGVKQRTYSDYESGRIRMKVEQVIALARYYDVSMDYICGATDIQTKYPEF